MSGDVLKVALAQVNLLVGDVQGNLARVVAESRLAGEQGADLVVFPELTLSGYPPEDLLFHRGLRAQVVDAVAALASTIAEGPKDGAALPAVIVGYPEYVGSASAPQLYNSAVLLRRDGPRANHRKNCLPNYRVFDEKRYFSAGDLGQLAHKKLI